MTHESVLLQELIRGLGIRPGDVVLDATAGSGGHALAACEKVGPRGTVIVLDRDADALLAARRRLSECRGRTVFVEEWYRNLGAVLDRLGIGQANRIMFDLGMSSLQIEESRRGFSFLRDEPLLMTYARDPDPNELTAATIVNFWPARDLARIIREYGEERAAESVTRAIVRARSEKPIVSSRELAGVVAGAIGGRRGRIHPATKTFQAIRMAVNDELDGLAEGLEAARERLAPAGRVAVISFESVTDRLVKKSFRAWEEEGEGRVVTKKPVVPSRGEILKNPRARSAKLRIFERAAS